MVAEIDTLSQNPDNLEGNSSLVTPELTQAIKDSIQPIMVDGYRAGQTFLAIGSQHGDRRMLQINVHATEIPTLLRARSVAEESNNPNSGKNRPIDNKHVEKIKDYIRERAKAGNKWILGTITANVDPSKIKYQKIWGDLYVVFIYNSTSLEITDGQHRKKAIKELIEFEGEDRDLICNVTFPVNLVLEGELEQCQTDFRDMAQTLPIAKSLLVAYGGYGKEAIAKAVVEQVNMFRNKTQKIKSTTGSKTGYIYTINFIAKLVSCAFAGNPANKLSEVNTDEVQERSIELSDCLNYFFINYAQTANNSEKEHNWKKMAKLTGDIFDKEKLYWKQATEYRENCILGISVGLETLGDLLYYTLDHETNFFDRNKVKQLAEEIDWSRQGECWKDTLISPDGKGGIKLNTGRGSVSAAKERCLKQLGWSKN